MCAMTDREPLLKLGTRGSPLALYQAEAVKARLAAADPDLAKPGAIEIVVIKTTGDKVQDRPLAEIGGKGLFLKEIEEALKDGRIDAAVHSMKDVPTWLEPGFALAAFLPREDVRDAFLSPVASSLMELPEGAVVGSSSLRRQAQILAKRPDLKVVSLRGNVQTRLRKLAEGEAQATLLAYAGLKRLEMEREATALFDAGFGETEMLPAAAQGAIGVEIRDDDARAAAWLAAIDTPATRIEIEAERACLDVLDGSCQTPIAALAHKDANAGDYHLWALVAEPDGSQVWRAERRAPPEDLIDAARDAGQELRAAAGEAFFERLKDRF
jgi:hydroxymethylbilane synthase